MKVNRNMRITSVMLPENHIEDLEDAVRDEYFINISDSVRVALRDLYKKHGIFDIEKFNGYGQR